MKPTLICLDTNVWIAGILNDEGWSAVILNNLDRLNVIIPYQVYVELRRNLGDDAMSRLYQIIEGQQAVIDFTPIASHSMEQAKSFGLKKGDAVIAAFCALFGINFLVSENRHFLREMKQAVGFEVLSPEAFCIAFGLN